jgi:hypothetical protein
MRRWLLLLTSVAGLAQAAPPGPPPRIEIAYEMSRDGSVMADVVEVLEHGGGRYLITETSKGRGIYALAGRFKRTSRGTVDAGGVRPLEFLDERPGRDSRATFDWQARTVTTQYKGTAQALPMPDQVQDRLSFLLAFALFPPQGKSVTYSVADGRGLATHLFSVEAGGKVKTPAGEFSTRKLTRVKQHERIETWLAAELGYLPVRVLMLDKDGRRLEQVAVRISASAP